MAKNKRYNIPYRRRRQGKTNYKRRLSLLKSRTARLVIRKTNRNTIVQLVTYDPQGDKVLVTFSTDQLQKHGWKHSNSSIPAAYLTGFFAGAAAKKHKVSEAVVDIGMQKPFHGGRIFAAVKGAKEAGLNIHVSEDAFPSEERINGKHINETIAKDIDAVKKKAGA